MPEPIPPWWHTKFYFKTVAALVVSMALVSALIVGLDKLGIMWIVGAFYAAGALYLLFVAIRADVRARKKKVSDA